MSLVSVLRKPEVELRTGLSASSIDRLEAAGNFPKRMKLSPNAVGWMSNEVQDWIASRPRGEMVPGLEPVEQVASLKKQIGARSVTGGEVDRLEQIANSAIASGSACVLGNQSRNGGK